MKYEPGILETCLNLLQISPQHQKNRRIDYLNRNNPIYISRVVSAMVSANRFRLKTWTCKVQDRDKSLSASVLFHQCFYLLCITTRASLLLVKIMLWLELGHCVLHIVDMNTHLLQSSEHSVSLAGTL